MRPEACRRVLVLMMVFALLILAMPGAYGAEGGDGWRKEFDDVCGRTSESQSLAIEELQHMIDRCDKLKPQIENLGESERKVFLRRLKMCRDLYQYVLDSKK